MKHVSNMVTALADIMAARKAWNEQFFVACSNKDDMAECFDLDALIDARTASYLADTMMQGGNIEYYDVSQPYSGSNFGFMIVCENAQGVVTRVYHTDETSPLVGG